MSWDAPNVTQEIGGTPIKASPFPLIVSGISMLASVAIYFVFPHDALLTSLIGYLLTPIVSALCLAWGQALDVSGRRSVWYSPNSNFKLLLKILAIASFLVGIAHMWNIASIIGARVA
jgi:hypothetical protein